MTHKEDIVNKFSCQCPSSILKSDRTTPRHQHYGHEKVISLSDRTCLRIWYLCKWEVTERTKWLTYLGLMVLCFQLWARYRLPEIRSRIKMYRPITSDAPLTVLERGCRRRGEGAIIPTTQRVPYFSSFQLIIVSHFTPLLSQVWKRHWTAPL